VDFHHLGIGHAWHTKKKKAWFLAKLSSNIFCRE